MKRTSFLYRYRALLIAGVLLLIGVGLYWFGPIRYALVPKCPFRLLTGWSCPGCGLQRAVHALLHGRLWEAYTYNLFFIFSIPYLLAACCSLLCYPKRWRAPLHHFCHHNWVVYPYVALFFAWWVLRNWLEI